MNLELYADMFYNGDLISAHSHYLLAKLQNSGVFSTDITQRKSALKTGFKNLLAQNRISKIDYENLLTQLGD